MSATADWTIKYATPMLAQYKLAIIDKMQWEKRVDGPDSERGKWDNLTASEAAAFVNEMAAALVKHDEEFGK